MTKTLTFSLMHFGIAFTVVYLMTGDILVGGAVAVIEPAINTLGYHFHEKLWAARQNRPANPKVSLLCGHASGTRAAAG